MEKRLEKRYILGYNRRIKPRRKGLFEAASAQKGYKMRGKDTCKTLKEIRKNIAEKNGIQLEIEECTYEGDCSGTCPKCEAELRELECALDEKEARGERVDRTAKIEPPKQKPAAEAELREKPPFPEPLSGLVMPPPEEPRGERNEPKDSADIPEPLMGEVAVEYHQADYEEMPMGKVAPPKDESAGDPEPLNDLQGYVTSPRKKGFFAKLRSLFSRRR